MNGFAALDGGAVFTDKPRGERRSLKMKKSPFQQLVQALEGLHYVKAIQAQARPDKYDSLFVMGYCTALQDALKKAEDIYRNR